MNAASPLQAITVGGDALHARFVAILLAHALGPHGCRVMLGELDEDQLGARSAVVGPTTLSALAATGIPPDRLFAAGARQTFQWSLSGIEVMTVPFGTPRGGVDFHHHLHRAHGELTYEAILPFNPAHHLGKCVAAHGPVSQPPVPYGLLLPRGSLLHLMDDGLQRLGVNTNGEGRTRASFSFSVFGDGSAEWEGSEITLPVTGAFPELGLYRCAKAIDRFLSLLPGIGASPSLSAEFNRLSQAENERIADFAALLVKDFNRPAVVRKRDVFAACGRIPIEDYEVIPAHYWLGVFLQSGIAPRDYDRLADRFPLQETKAWLVDLLRQLNQLSGASA